jgi:CRP-like cAMP-binding protein
LNRREYLRVNGSDFKISELGEGDLFGEYSFFSGCEREITVRSVETSTVLYLTRKDFVE